jgi:hypothetical protein
MHGDTDGGSAHHRQIEDGGSIADTAAVFAGDDVQAKMEAGFNAPVVAIAAQHLLSVELGSRERTEQKLGFNALGRMAFAVDAAGEPGRLFDKGEVDRRGGSVKSNEAARLSATAVEFAALRDARFG